MPFKCLNCIRSSLTTNIDICVEEPIATPSVMSWERIVEKELQYRNITYRNITNKAKHQEALTSLSFMANMMALACSAAFPTIGRRMTLIKATGIFNDSDAP